MLDRSQQRLSVLLILLCLLQGCAARKPVTVVGVHHLTPCPDGIGFHPHCVIRECDLTIGDIDNARCKATI